LIFCIAIVLFVANFALGILVQVRIVDTKPFRWLHHALFFAVFLSVAVGFGFLQGAPYRWILLPVLVLLVLLPRVRAGTPGHAALAGGTMILYVTGFVWML
jgi:isoprenylcysteine carboxyl methyltransferase (ICMT) family protein YpbQ